MIFLRAISRHFMRLEQKLGALDPEYKDAGTFSYGAVDLAGGGAGVNSLDELKGRVTEIRRHAGVFYGPSRHPRNYVRRGASLTFQSSVQTNDSHNDTVHCTIYESVSRRQAMIIVPHWNAGPTSYDKIGRILRWLGITTVCITLPHHGPRDICPGPIANDFLNADVGAAILCVRQSVIDTRDVVRWLKEEGYGRVSVVGLSLGSCIAAIAAAFDDRIDRALLFLTAGDFAKVVWTSSATVHIRRALEEHIELSDLQQAWSLISPSTYIPEFVARGMPILIVSGRHDDVVKPDLTREFVDQLRGNDVRVRWYSLPCGHYTLGVMPFSLVALVLLAQFLRAVRAG